MRLRAFAVLALFFSLTLAIPPQRPFSVPQNLTYRGTFPQHPESDLGPLSNSSFHEQFQPLAKTQEFLRNLASAFPDNVTLESIGQSSEGRPIMALSITRPQVRRRKGGLKKKPRFVLLGAQHARDWIATSTALYLSHALLANETEPRSLAKLLDHFDFYIVPVPNPDGFQYTWDEDRFWKVYKNRREIAGHKQCRGIDMNRNWGIHWEPSSTPVEGPCAAWYPGEGPFEAPEVDALANYFGRLKRVRAFLDLRSYGQMVSTPYSYSCDVVPPEAEDMLEAAHGAAAALRLVHGTPMRAGRLCETLYRAPGNILDWMYVKKRVKYSFAVHLRDTGTHGYMLPPEWIRPVGEETAGLVSYLVEFLALEKRIKS